MTGWEGFGEGLAQQLSTLAAESVLIIRDSGPTNRYVQFLQTDSRLLAELVSDHWLEPAVRAGESGARLIAEAGWRQPESTVPDGNWETSLDWPSPARDYRRLAAMSVAGLRDGLRISGPEALVYDAWSPPGNRPLRLPLLGIEPKA
ncbi:hypothetical protein GCM10010329_30030 [Streptomyces spiroverticillatus]|uniref:TY-Chap N-terminal domain-containing protein n=1 Tax=Streptomyces finlayi TaxID=67296 RepID=A0A918WW62_9ACTN|nr:hypothetical protein [Streptomyces finlayi]GHA05565.1 hypothetical protein GCM10010329_30030 [Streptomyces spiroverticillatus]GHC89410.1 hypothetical protein GCM10010334_22440 [Streptomyces finlayi]